MNKQYFFLFIKKRMTPSPYPNAIIAYNSVFPDSTLPSLVLPTGIPNVVFPIPSYLSSRYNPNTGSNNTQILNENPLAGSHGGSLSFSVVDYIDIAKLIVGYMSYTLNLSGFSLNNPTLSIDMSVCYSKADDPTILPQIYKYTLFYPSTSRVFNTSIYVPDFTISSTGCISPILSVKNVQFALSQTPRQLATALSQNNGVILTVNIFNQTPNAPEDATKTYFFQQLRIPNPSVLASTVSTTQNMGYLQTSLTFQQSPTIAYVATQYCAIGTFAY